VAVARALAMEPSLMLADEPTGNLDSKSTADVLDLLDDIHDEGKTIVIITHEDEVAARADRVVTLRDGRIESDVLAAHDDLDRSPTQRLAGDPGESLRSILTTLGIMIGVAAVIILVAFGQGASNSVTSSIQSLGSNLLTVTGRTPTGVARS
jgi:macrolide transport system ATP-binding/permease protein